MSQHPIGARSRASQLAPWTAVCAGGALVLALTGALAWLAIVGGRDDVDRLAQAEAANIAQTLQSDLAGQLDQIDAVLHDVATASADDLQGASLESARHRVPELELIALVDSQDRVVASRGNAPPATLPALARAAAAQAASGPAGTRVAASVAGGQGRLLLVHRRADPAGGLVVAVLPLSFLARFIEPVDVGSTGSIALRDASLRLLVRKLGRGAMTSDPGPPRSSGELVANLGGHPAGGAFRAVSAIDGVERLTAYRQVGAWPLTVLAGVGLDEARAGWRRQSLMIGGLAGLLMAVVVLGGTTIARAWRQARANAAAFESQARRNRMLLRTASDGLHVLDRAGRLVKFSDSFAAALGRERADLEGAHVSSWDASHDAPTIAEWLRTFQPGEHRRFESVHRRADGSTLLVELTCSMVSIDGRDLIYCSARDITRRRELEDLLAASAREIQSLYDQAPCAYHSLDADGHYVHINDTELAWLGCRREDVVGRRGPRDFLDAAGVEAFERAFQRLLAGEPVDGLEVDLRGPAGQVRRVCVSATAMRDESGRFLMSRSVMYDVTELHRARERLHELMREQQAMLDNDLVGMARVREGRIVWSNQAMCRLFGYAPEELAGATMRPLHADQESFDRVTSDSGPVLEADGRYRCELTLLRKGGEPLWIQVNGMRLSAPRRESMWLFSDLTPSRRAYDRVEFLAFHDALTGLPNRMLLDDRLGQALNVALRIGCQVAVCYVDLDGFKALNDHLGHAAGDLLLKEVATRLAACTRTVDTVCRLGGDEFVLVLSQLSGLEQCREIIQRVEAALHATVVLQGFGEATISASIGVALFPTDAYTPDALLAFADLAMYEAKRRHDGRACFHGAARAS